MLYSRVTGAEPKRNFVHVRSPDGGGRAIASGILGDRIRARVAEGRRLIARLADDLCDAAEEWPR